MAPSTPKRDEPDGRPDEPATKPRRGCLARGWRLCCRTVVVLILLYLGLAVYYSLGSPKQTVDYVERLNERAAAVPEADRAWPVYRAALVGMGLEDRDDNPNLEIFKGAVVPEEEGWPATAAYVESHREQVAQLRVAAGMPGLGYIAGFEFDDADRALFPDAAGEPGEPGLGLVTDNLLISVPLRHFYAIRWAGRVLAVDALLAAEQNDGDTCTADLIALTQIGRHADEHVSVINQLIRLWANALAVHTLNQVVVDYPERLSDAQLEALARAVDSIAVFTLDYEGERLTFDDFVQHNFTDNGRGGGRVYLPHDRDFHGAGGVNRALRFLAGPVVANATASRRELTDEYHRMIDLAQAQADVPRWREPESQVTQAVMQYNDSLIRRYRYRLVRTLLPAIGAVRNVAERYQANAEGAQVGLALEQYRRAHGGYPETLDALVPQYLDTLPFDRINGEPLRYRVGEDGPVVYSVGADGDDDGGRAPGEYETRDRPEGVWQADLNAAARWGSRARDPIDGDWVSWPLHNTPVMPEPERDPDYDDGFLLDDE